MTCAPTPGLQRVPRGAQRAPADEIAAAAAAPPPAEDTPPRLPTLPVRWIDSDTQLRDACDKLRQEDAVALDVETTLYTPPPLPRTARHPRRDLHHRRLPDHRVRSARRAPRRSPCRQDHPQRHLREERAGAPRHHHHQHRRHLELSRAKHGRQIGDGHKLGVVCERELGIELDKTEQTSDWSLRPLTKRQLAYAALDVEVLPPLWDRLQTQSRLF
ncbi:MAG: hypothetical protein IPK80_28985 [Nannocystis sp.]|nr:hypothetical protein [Nannocystis sp.]